MPKEVANALERNRKKIGAVRRSPGCAQRHGNSRRSLRGRISRGSLRGSRSLRGRSARKFAQKLVSARKKLARKQRKG